MNKTILGLMLAASCMFQPPSMLRADGGAIRLSERKGGYQITVFTSPTPFRAGPVDVSVFVLDAGTGEPRPDVCVTVRAAPRDRPAETVSYPATVEAATNKLFRAAVFELSEPGWWDMEVLIEGEGEPVQVRFAVEAAAPTPPWLVLWPWVGWPIGVIALYCVHQFLVARRAVSHAKTHTPPVP